MPAGSYQFFDDKIFAGYHMDYSPIILRSKRKTYEIEIHPDGRVVVRAPQRATQAQVEAVIQRKETWIRKKLELLRATRESASLRQYADGETFRYLGESYPLKIAERGARALELRGGYFILRRADLPRARVAFEAWYRAQARQVLADRVSRWSAANGFKPGPLRISGARTRWGSCGPRGSLNFAWRLVQAPMPVIEYVVVHELVHLEVRNHSRLFWEKVRSLLPDYKERLAWLKQNGRYLDLP
jgi:predicted metal-dependent hydrolase